MKLILCRNQQEKKGLFGGHKGMAFELSYRLELTPEEQALIRTYKAGSHPILVTEGNPPLSETVEDLLQGVTQVVDDVTTLVHNERELKEACRQFKTLLQVMATFGGEEIVEY